MYNVKEFHWDNFMKDFKLKYKHESQIQEFDLDYHSYKQKIINYKYTEPYPEEFIDECAIYYLINQDNMWINFNGDILFRNLCGDSVGRRSPTFYEYLKYTANNTIRFREVPLKFDCPLKDI